MIINGRKIGPGEPPYIVAEIGASHGGNFERAVILMSAAVEAGADAVKFQCYTPDTITLDCDKPDFIIKDGPWKGRKLHELYQKTHTPFEWFPGIFEVAKRYGVTVFASVFDKTSVDLLESLGCPAYKIASMEIVDIPLIKYVAATGKPMIVSTGMARTIEIEDAIAAITPSVRSRGVALLHCVSGYPTDLEEANLWQVKDLVAVYGIPYADNFKIGISDHTKGIEIPVAATAMGAQIIEKHIRMWSKWEDGPTCAPASEDDAFSLNPDDFREMCKAVRSVWKAMQPSEAKSEESSRQLRRGLYVVEDMKAGEVFTEQNVRSIRPAYGFPPKEIGNVLGKVATQDIERGTALSWDLVGLTCSSQGDQVRLAQPS